VKDYQQWLDELALPMTPKDYQQWLDELECERAQSKAKKGYRQDKAVNLFSGGIPTLLDGTPDYQAIERALASVDPIAALRNGEVTEK
jgi:hypothetical protein